MKQSRSNGLVLILLTMIFLRVFLSVKPFENISSFDVVFLKATTQKDTSPLSELETESSDPKAFRDLGCPEALTPYSILIIRDQQLQKTAEVKDPFCNIPDVEDEKPDDGPMPACAAPLEYDFRFRLPPI